MRKGYGTGVPDSFFALTGCSQPTNTTNRGCGNGPEVTHFHVTVEGWTRGYIQTWDEIQVNFPYTAPKIAGSMGYSGVISLYIPVSAQQKAYESEGRSVEYYRDWNVSWSDPSQYFASPNDVEKSRLKPCQETTLSRVSAANRLYGELTGDWDGLVMQGDGQYHAKCFDQYFWYSPACRSNSSKCVLVISGGDGWSLEEFMQKAAAHNMPMALCVASGWQDYSTLPMEYVSAFYWWTPDPTFLTIDPKTVIFPPFDRLAHEIGDRRTTNEAQRIDKYVSKDTGVLSRKTTL